MDKIAVAEIQLNAAIRLLFADAHPVAVHTLVAAGFRVLRDLGVLKKSKMLEQFVSTFKPEYRDKVWGKFNTPANFFKHADKDPDDHFEFSDERINDFTILMAATLFLELANRESVEMRAFSYWFGLVHPELLMECEIKNFILTERAKTTEFLRSDWLRLGLEALKYEEEKAKR